MKHLHSQIIVFIAVLAMSGCVKDRFAVNKKFSGDIEWNPELAIPLAKAKLTLSDMLKERQDTLMYISENAKELGYGSNPNDKVLVLRFGIDTAQPVNLLSLPAMDGTDTSLHLKPVSIPAAKLKLPLAQSIETVLGDNFPTYLATFRAYSDAFPVPQNTVAITTASLNHEYPLDGGNDLSNEFKYLFITEGRIKLTCFNAFTVPIQCDVELFADDEDGVKQPIGLFPLSAGNAFIPPLAITNASDLNGLANLDQKIDNYINNGGALPDILKNSSISKTITVNNKYIGQKIYYTYKNLKFAASGTPVPVTFTNTKLFSVVEFEDLKVGHGYAKVPKQVINDTTMYVRVSTDKSKQKLREVHVERGAIECEILSRIDITTHFIFTFPTVTDATGKPLHFDREIKPKEIISDVINLDNHKMILTKSRDSDNSYNSLPIELAYRVNADGMQEFRDTQSITLKIRNRDSIHFKFIKGNLGEGTEDIMDDKIDFNISEILNFIDGNVRFADPRLNLRFENPIGADAEINLNLVASNDKGESVNLFTGGSRTFPLSNPDCDGVLVGDRKLTEIPVDSSNSNVVNFLYIIPNYIEYSGELRYNKGDTEATKENCVSKMADAGIAIDVDVPMNLSFGNLLLATDLPIENPIGDAWQLDTLVIFLKAANHFPIDARLAVVMLDTTKPEKQQKLGVLDRDKDGNPLFLLKAAQTDKNGKVLRGTVESHVLTAGVGKNLFDAFTHANKIRIEVLLDTKDEKSGKSVILYSYYSIDVQIAANGKILIKDRVN